MHLTTTFIDLLQTLRPAFTAPSFANLLVLLAGWTLSSRPRRVTDLILTADATSRGHFSRYHRFFSSAVWSFDTLSQLLARLLIRTFAPDGQIVLAVDDTLCRKRGLNLFGAGLHYDPLLSSKSKAVVSWGHDWVVLSLIVSGLPWSPTKVWALPLAFRLYKNRQKDAKARKGGRSANGRTRKPRHVSKAPHFTRTELAVQLITLVARWFPDREFLVLGDSAYGGQSVLKKLPARVDLISRVDAKATLFAPAPERVPGQKGRPRKKGVRLDGMKAWADDESRPWADLTFAQYGLHAALRIKVQQALYYKAGGERLLTIVLVRDREGGRPDQMFFCTRLDWEGTQVLATYAGRWSCEVMHRDAKQLLGLEDPMNRTADAVERTAPMALVLVSLTVVWYHEHGRRWAKWPVRPWYRRKSEPSFADLLATLRCWSWREYLMGDVLCPEVDETRLSHLIWSASHAG